ncbi:MAG: ABC transporter permease subunit [Chloroflexota bacterium]
MTLFRQFLRTQRTALLIWLGAVVLMALALAGTSQSMQQSDLVERLVPKLPPAFQALLGLVPGLSGIDSFIAAKLGVMLGLVLPAYACLLAVSAVTREVDAGRMDFLLALPIERRQLLIARWAGMVVNLTIVAVGGWAALVAGLKANGIAGSYSGYFWMTVQALLLGLGCGSLAMLASIWLDDYGAAVKYILGGLVVLFALDLGMKVLNVSKLARGFNPFAYYDAALPIAKNHLLWGDALVMLATSLVAVWLAGRAFAGKQIQ